MHRHWMAITFTRALAHVPRRLPMWSPLQKYTVQQFRRGMLLQLINIVLCTLSLIFNNTYFLVALVFTCNTWWLLRWRRYCGLLFPLLSYPLAMYATVSHNVFPAIPAVLGLTVCFLIYSAIMLLLFRSEFKDESDPA